jgi:Flp pilus assembly protein TadG
MFPVAIKRATQRLVVKSRVGVNRAVRTFSERTEGIAAVEFALILPIMAMMMIGAIEMSQAVTIDRRVSQVAAATGDLVARIETDIQESEIRDISKIGKWLLGSGFDQTKLTINLSLVSVPCPPRGACPTTPPAVNDPTIRTRWTCSFNSNTNATTCSCPVAPYTMPAVGLIGFGDAVIVADVAYDYFPMFFDTFMNQASPKAGAFGVRFWTLRERLHLKTRGLWTRLNMDSGTVCTAI